MNDNKDKVLFYIKEFTKRHGYTPTTYQAVSYTHLDVYKRQAGRRYLGCIQVRQEVQVCGAVH